MLEVWEEHHGIVAVRHPRDGKALWVTYLLQGAVEGKK